MKKTLLLTLCIMLMSFILVGCTEEDPLANAEIEKSNETVEYILPEEKQ